VQQEEATHTCSACGQELPGESREPLTVTIPGRPIAVIIRSNPSWIDPIIEPIAWGRAHIFKPDPWSGLWSGPTLHIGFEDGDAGAVFTEIALEENPRPGRLHDGGPDEGWIGLPDLPPLGQWS
jgi:hypothetical protein